MSKQQTLFHHFLNRQEGSSSRQDVGDGTLHESSVPSGQKAINQDDLIAHFDDDDVLLAACEDWDENTHSPSNGNCSNDNNARSAGGYQTVPGSARQPVEQSHQQPIPQATQLEDLPGFDVSAGKIWIYPINYPVREYQYNIVQQALFKNTMVSLPTGLGKTFVAAVIMYNFYRWYPEGRVVFMAPTKPLVAQQIEACHSVMGIPQTDMAEMTGNMPPVERKKVWHRCRVFFLTPQVLMNDLSRRTCPSQLVKCLVVDEAHKALGNHAYCQVVRELSKYSSEFRVVALSATPGSDLKAIQQVLANLLISHIEIRSEESIDIQRYVHERKVEKVVVPLDDELKSIRDHYLQILSVYVGKLTRCGALYSKDPASLTKFQILQSRDAFRQNPPEQVKSRGVVEGDFALCISLYHGFELLLQHGLRSLCSFLQKTVDEAKGFSRTRQELMRNAQFVQLMDKLRDKFGVREEHCEAANRSHLFSSPGTPKVREVTPYVTSHPKMARLQEIVLEHFRNADANGGSATNDKPSASKARPSPAALSTRVMIFAQYRDSVNEIAEMLNRHHPLLRCMGFVGQASTGKNSKGISQKEQLRVVREFREGGYNTLVCTCVGEEGLDIGDVDLIVCYDAHKSPIRLVQRMGRTGRKRQGRIVMLVTEGKEAAIYDRSQYSKKGIVKALQGSARSLQLYPNSPRMVPRGLNPAPHKMFISVEAFTTKKDSRQRPSARARSEAGMSTFMSKAKSSKKAGEFLSPEELAYWSANYKLDAAERDSLPAMPEGGHFVTLEAKDDKQTTQRTKSRPTLSLTEWSPWQMNKQPIGFVEHSHRCHQFVELMEFIDLQNLTDGYDIYGLEMQTYLDQDDIARPRKKGIEQFYVRVRRGNDSADGEELMVPPETSKAKQHQASVGDSIGEPTRKKRGRVKRRTQPLELVSSSSDISHTDDNLPDVFSVETEEPVAQQIPDGRKTCARAGKNDCGVEARRKVETPAEGESDMANKPRKHKQKTKHLRPVLDSSDDDDFTNNLKQGQIFGNRKSVSPGKREDIHEMVSPETDSAHDGADCLPNQETADEEYDTPQPMDTDSDTFLTLKSRANAKPAPDNGTARGLLLPQIEDDLSFLFPTQSIGFPYKENQKVSGIRPREGKLVIPPPPPSLSSLDLLDDLDSSFNLTQHFQSDSNYFGGAKEPRGQPSVSTSDEGSVKDEKVSKPTTAKIPRASEPNPPECFINIPSTAVTDSDEAKSDRESNTITNLSLTEMKESQCHNSNNYPGFLAGIEPRFDLNMDFSVISSSEDEAETGNDEQKTKMKDQSMIEPAQAHDSDYCSDIHMVSVVDSPQAFDVQTPQVESTLVKTSFTSFLKVSGSVPPPHNPSLSRGKTTPSIKTLLTNNTKLTTTGMPDTPKSGLEPQTKSGWLRDALKAPGGAEKQEIGSRRKLDLTVRKEEKLRISAVRDDRNQVKVEDLAEIGRSSTDVLGPAEFDLDIQEPRASRTSTLLDDRALVQQEEDPAEIERLRMQVMGSAEPKFDLGFDLDTLDEEEDSSIVPPSPNMQQQQEYINLTQVAMKMEQCSSASRGTMSVLARASSTPVSKLESTLQAASHSDFLSPITIDKECNPVFTEESHKISVDPVRRLSHTDKRKSFETTPALHHANKRKSSDGKSPTKQETTKLSTEPLLTSTLSGPQPLSIRVNFPRSLAEDEECFDAVARSTLVGKRKSSPSTGLANGGSFSVKRRKSASSGPSLGGSPHSGPAVSELRGKKSAPLGSCRQRRNSPESGAEPSCSQRREARDSGKQPIASSDEDDALFSQDVQCRKRCKAVALRSPPTPVFKTPVKPSAGVGTKNATAKPAVTSSDDDLESPLIRRPKKRRQIIATTDVDDDFIGSSSKKTETTGVVRRVSNEKRLHSADREQKNKHKTQKKRSRIASGGVKGFLDEEAKVSDSEGCSSDELGSDLDNSLEGFINNASQLTQASQSALATADMHAVYMQSVRSPNVGGLLYPGRNRFKMMESAVPDNLEIFSQDDTYCENSFVVRGGEDDELVDAGSGRQEKGRQFEESLFDNTINPDNIITSRRRGRHQGKSRAQLILKGGRRQALMTSSSASTSTEETDENWRGPDRKRQLGDNRKGQKGPCPGKDTDKKLITPGWLSAGKHYQDLSSVKLELVRKPATEHRATIIGKTPVQQLTAARERECQEDNANKQHRQSDSSPNQMESSVIRHFLEESRSHCSTYPDDIPNQKQALKSNRPESRLIVQSGLKHSAEDGLTLAEKERAERLKRQEEKKREFMRKMEEKKRQREQEQHLQELQQKVLQHQQHQKQQQHQLKLSQEHQQYQKQQRQSKWSGEQVLKNELQASSSRGVQESELGTAFTAAAKSSQPTQKPLRTQDSPAAMETPQSFPMSPSSMQLMKKTTLAGTQEALTRGKPVILIDSKELSSSPHIASTLALRYRLNPSVCQLSGCDYVVSARMGVEKKSISDFGNIVNRTKLIDRMRHLCELFDRPCLILEKDRIKPADNKKPRQLIRTKYFDSVLARLTKTHIKVLYSDSVDDTARILADLVCVEARKGEGLAPLPSVDTTQEQVLKFYLSLPRVSYGTALSLTRAFPCAQQLINSSAEQLQRMAKISLQRAAEIVAFLGHQFDEQMTGPSTSR